MTSLEIKNLSQISEYYDAFLIDAWGVLHDGGQVFPLACECLQNLKLQNKKVVIVSNAARRTADFNRELAATGIDLSTFDFSVSSGELFWQNFKNETYSRFGKHCYYLGPERSRGIIKGLELTLVDTLEDADFILNTGAEGNLSDALSFTPLLAEALDKKLQMICANPDLVAIRKGIRGISAGAIAKLYQELGGEVEYVGKPHEQIFRECIQILPDIPQNRILMIGDGLQTDILGANKFGIDSLFIRNGIYREQIEMNCKTNSTTEKIVLNELFLTEGASPDYVINQLIF